MFTEPEIIFDYIAIYKFDFLQYDLWICDSVKVGHQIINGDKLAAFSYVFTENSKIQRKILQELDYVNYINSFLNSFKTVI